MGKTITPKYYAKYLDQSGWHDISWQGKATNTRAESMRQTLNKSFNKEGCNWHASLDCGYVVHVSKLKVMRNDGSRRVVAETSAPMFEIVGDEK